MHKPQTNRCPFCKNNLVDYWRDQGYVHTWYCADCKCDTDSSMPRYVVICFTMDKSEAYQQEFGIKNFYIKNNYEGKETTLNVLQGCVAVTSIKLPFKTFDLEDASEEELISKFKLYLTFS